MMSNPIAVEQQAVPCSGLKAARALHPAEYMLTGIVLLLAFASLALTLGLQRQVAWAGFAPGILAAFGMVALGGYARLRMQAERLASGAIGIGLFMGFTAFASICTFALFPLQRPLVDLPLIAADAAFGYDWAGFVMGLANYPLLGTALSYVYRSALVQMVIVIILLAAYGRRRDLQRFLLIGMASIILTISIFYLWPSIGPSAYASIPEDAAARIQLVFTSAVGNHSQHLVDVGPEIISPETIVGLVAFPSFHIIMALMVCWFSRRTIAFPAFALSGLAMIPATLAHGGHHLMDLFGGAALFLALQWLARWLLPDEPTLS